MTADISIARNYFNFSLPSKMPYPPPPLPTNGGSKRWGDLPHFSPQGRIRPLRKIYFAFVGTTPTRQTVRSKQTGSEFKRRKLRCNTHPHTPGFLSRSSLGGGGPVGWGPSHSRALRCFEFLGKFPHRNHLKKKIGNSDTATEHNNGGWVVRSCFGCV